MAYTKTYALTNFIINDSDYSCSWVESDSWSSCGKDSRECLATLSNTIRDDRDIHTILAQSSSEGKGGSSCDVVTRCCTSMNNKLDLEKCLVKKGVIKTYQWRLHQLY